MPIMGGLLIVDILDQTAPMPANKLSNGKGPRTTWARRSISMEGSGFTTPELHGILATLIRALALFPLPPLRATAEGKTAEATTVGRWGMAQQCQKATPNYAPSNSLISRCPAYESGLYYRTGTGQLLDEGVARGLRRVWLCASKYMPFKHLDLVVGQG
jgi:hypothetical protein